VLKAWEIRVGRVVTGAGRNRRVAMRRWPLVLRLIELPRVESQPGLQAVLAIVLDPEVVELNRRPPRLVVLTGLATAPRRRRVGWL